MVSAASQVTPLSEARKSQVAGLSLEEIVRRIQILESSGGINNYSKCAAIGKFNRYGFGIYGGHYLCFEKDEDTAAVKNWFEEKLKSTDLKTALCLYNLGAETESCHYSKMFYNL